MRYHHTPIRIANGQVYAWIQNKARRPITANGCIILPGEFYLARPTARDKVLHSRWGKAYSQHMTTPKE